MSCIDQQYKNATSPVVETCLW